MILVVLKDLEVSMLAVSSDVLDIASVRRVRRSFWLFVFFEDTPPSSFSPKME